ncbi:RNI-like protein [Auricularia subglabra TFB-10046 SS5]|nr:RNI-like protein [Auricularia subglabra TFB-10046 SS5]
MSTLQPGDRFILNDHYGTVRWSGEVQGTKGVWLGVEWDDPQRGKHDGVKDGVRYFHCSIPNAGSFIRETAALNRGRAFLEAFYDKYLDEPLLPAGGIEKVTLGSSNGVIEVEAVNLNKIRSKLSNFARLREVSLDGQAVAKAGRPEDLRDKFPSLRGLDLTRNLLPNWDEVIAIAASLPSLLSLSLNYNHLRPLVEPLHVTAFARLQELWLNGTLVTWDQFALLSPSLPELREIQLGYNRLQSLITTRPIECTKLEIVNVDANEFQSWLDLMSALQVIPKLSRFIATSNSIAQIPPPTDENAPLRTVHHLALSENKLGAWADIDALSAWLPELKSLTLEHASYAAQFIITRIPTLEVLNGTEVSAHKRQDAELYYMSVVEKQGYKSPEALLRDHPRWTELCAKHGPPGQTKEAETATKLSGKLVSVVVLALPGAPDQLGLPDVTQQQSMRVLKTMNLRTFRAKIRKAFKIEQSQELRLWMFIEGDQGVGSLEMDGDRDLDWWDIEEGSRIGFVAE